MTLATHDFAHAMHGRWMSWFEDDALEALEREECLVEVLVSEREALDALTYAFQTARLSFERVDDPEVGVVLRDIQTPRGEVFGRPVVVDDVLRRAVYTGLTPGEAGRLTGEEIVGLMLGVWHD